jgi:hypothetical protein
MITDTFLLNKEVLGMFALHLNTAYFMGSDSVKLAARLHGQCELHTYVEGPNRQWLADIIKEGRSFKFYRDEMGWEGVIELLESASDGPVVTSFSVTEQFPNRYIADWNAPTLTDEDGEEYEDDDAWYNLPEEERWQMAMKGLRQERGGLEMKPDNWKEFHFGHGLDANQLISKLYEDLK